MLKKCECGSDGCCKKDGHVLGEGYLCVEEHGNLDGKIKTIRGVATGEIEVDGLLDDTEALRWIVDFIDSKT